MENVKLKEFSVGYGMSVEHRGTWYKFNSGATVEFTKDATAEERATGKEMAWNTCYDEVEKQINDLKNNS